MLLAKSAPDYNGILNVEKPRGMTSHDVVDFVRRQTGMRRVGHAGTLDPEAAGVLLVCLGQATRVSEFLMQGTKEYRATVRFGAVSSTDDAAGTLSPTGRTLDLDATAIEHVLSGFVGRIEQIPPVYSAIKVGGKPMYRHARAGQSVTIIPRTVTIERITLLNWSSPDLEIDVVCSKGTYIRSLARDIGQATGVGAFLQSLTRTVSGRFALAESVPLDEITRAARLGYLERLLYPLDVALTDFPAVFLTIDEVCHVQSGARWHGPSAPAEQLARAYTAGGDRLVGLLRFNPDTGDWHAAKIFGGSTLPSTDTSNEDIDESH